MKELLNQKFLVQTAHLSHLQNFPIPRESVSMAMEGGIRALVFCKSSPDYMEVRLWLKTTGYINWGR